MSFIHILEGRNLSMVAQKRKPEYDYVPDAMLASVPKLYTTENVADPLALIKLFTPDSNWSWFITEYDPDEKLAFGLAIGFEAELGYFSIDELEESRGPKGLPIERDLHFTPKPISHCWPRD
jgi:hypothetical protein